MTRRKSEKPGRPRAKSREYLQAIIDSLDDELMVIDRELRITQVNAVLLQDHGATSSEIIGQHCYQVSHGLSEPCRPPDCECPLQKVWESGKRAQVSHTHIYGPRDEDRKIVDIIATPLRDSEGNITEVVELMRDVTEAKRLEKQIMEANQARGELLQQLISAQEDERMRIARELHDETSQAITSLAVSLETVIAAIPPHDAEVKAKLREMQSRAIKILDETQRIIYELRPSLLDDLGLISAVRWYAESHLEAAGIKVDFETVGLERKLPIEMETALFRIVQEAINNITRHADAESASISLDFKENAVALHIDDDGRGFDLSKVTGHWLGLRGMRERVELLGGSLNVDAGPGLGTQIDVEIPQEEKVPNG